MNLNIIPLTEAMPTPKGGRDPYDHEFDEIFRDYTLMEPLFSDGTMLVIKGAAIQSWYADAGKKRKWVRNLDPNQAYAFGVDAFETEVS
jgi:hypothetical protein